MNENPDIAFYKVNDAPIDNNSKVNRRHPQFNEFKNLEYITYKELQMRANKCNFVILLNIMNRINNRDTDNTVTRIQL